VASIGLQHASNNVDHSISSATLTLVMLLPAMPYPCTSMPMFNIAITLARVAQVPSGHVEV